MINRIKQFYQACTAQINVEDTLLISKELNIEESKLFYSMATFDQYHSLKVYYSCMSLYNKLEDKKKVNLKLLKKAALLHDIGRTGSQITIMGKVYPVLLNKVISNKFINWSKKNINSNNIFIRLVAIWGNFFYLYRYHPLLSSDIILNLIKIYPYDKNFYINLSILVKHHHSYSLLNKTMELQLLQQADCLN